MNAPLHVLFIEDSEDDMLLQLREMRQQGLIVHYRRVQTADDLRQALHTQHWDLALSDYSLPAFTGLDALRILQGSGLDLPFVLISGTVGEDVAVECMRAGAADYLLKDNLTRLVPAVRRELREAEARRQRRQTERALQESQALLSLIYDHTAEMLLLFEVDDSGTLRVAAANRAWLNFAEQLGRPVTSTPPLGLTLDSLLDELAAQLEERQRLAAGFAEALAGPRIATFDLDWHRPAGTLFTEQHIEPVAHPGAALRHVLWAGRDVSERRQADDQRRRLEAQLTQAQKHEALGTLASAIAHDFNNILTALQGYAEIARYEVDHLPMVASALDNILQGTHRASDLVRRILTFSRKRPVQRQPMNLGPIIHEALTFLRPLIPTGVRVHLHLPTECPVVIADSGQMHQVVINLCTNAIQAMTPRGGTLTVTLTAVSLDHTFTERHAPLQPGRHVCLTVSDTGSGMAPETLTRLFEPFFTTKPLGQGTGLGMAVVHSVVKNHQGAIVVTSQPGQGSTFELYFPAALEQTQPPAVDMPARGAHLLLVDDEEYLARLGEAFLTRLGYQVSTFTDPEKACDAFLANPDAFAAVITDLSMPGLRGTDLALRLRQARPEVVVILTTGFSGPHELERARKLGFTLLLEKPFSVDKLLAVLRQALPGGENPRD